MSSEAASTFVQAVRLQQVLPPSGTSPNVMSVCKQRVGVAVVIVVLLIADRLCALAKMDE